MSESVPGAGGEGVRVVRRRSLTSPAPTRLEVDQANDQMIRSGYASQGPGPAAKHESATTREPAKRSSTRTPTTSPKQANEASVQAWRVRGEHLVALADGVLSPLDVIDAAATEEGRPLRRLSLERIFATVPGGGPKRARKIVHSLALRSVTRTELQRVRTRVKHRHTEVHTVSWLLDPRDRGKRYLTLLDVLTDKRGAPWSGFPYTSKEPSTTAPTIHLGITPGHKPGGLSALPLPAVQENRKMR